MTQRILVEILASGRYYYLSEEGFLGERFYYPFIKRIPTLELGQIENSGRVGIRYGYVTLTNEPTNPLHPFGLNRFSQLLTYQALYPIRIYWGEGNLIFSGSSFLNSITEEEISFTLTDAEIEFGFQKFSLTEAFVFVEGVSSDLDESGQEVTTITAEDHRLNIGSIVIFEKMESIGTDLQYVRPSISDLASDNYYYVGSVIDRDNFTIVSKDLLPVTGIPNGTYTSDGDNHRVGIPQRVPFAFGRINNRTPVLKKKKNEIANPDLVTSDSSTEPIEVREDGVLIYSTDPNSPEYWNKTDGEGNLIGGGVPPDDDVITLNRNTFDGTTLSITGTSRYGKTLQEFFEYCADELDLTLDTSRA